MHCLFDLFLLYSALYFILKGYPKMLKDYDLVHREIETFKVAGQTFAIRANVPRKALLVLADVEDDDTRVEQFFRTVLVKKDRERFIKLLNSVDDQDSAPAISIWQVNEIMNDLTDYVTGKPEGKDNSSTPGLSAIPEQSNVVPLPSDVVSPYGSGTNS